MVHRIYTLFLHLWDCLIYAKMGRWFTLFRDHGHQERILNVFENIFLTEGKLEHIHLFVSRNKVFDKESVLQETIIIKVRKTSEKPETVTITSSKSNSDFGELTSLTVPYDLVVAGADYYVYLVTDENEVEVLKKLHKFDKTLPAIGVKMKTGLTVDFVIVRF